MRLILVIAVSACLACLGYAFIELGLAARSIASEFALVASETRGTIKDTSERVAAATDAWQASSRRSLAYADWMMVNTNSTIKEVKGAVADIRDGVKEITASVKRTDENINGSNGLIPQISETVKNTDANLNGRVLPAATATLDRATAVLVELEGQARAVGDGLTGLTTEAARTTVAINAMVAGPLTETAGNVERGTLSAANTMDNLDRLTARWAKPMKAIWSVLSNVTGFGYRVFIKP